MNVPAAADCLLLVEDTPSLALLYQTVLSRSGHAVAVAGTGREATRRFAEIAPRIVLLDLMLPDADGLDLLGDMIEQRPETKVIVITANGSINRAVAAMRSGAFDFLVKPFDDRRLLSAIDNALSSRNAPAQSHVEDRFEGFVGSSPAMQDIYRMVRSIARSTATVFVTGESGTGKEVCARAIHARSNRADAPFIALNCGAIPTDLLESEVFGHLKGSFAGALADKQGAAALADGGTLFLDEICELPLGLQTKLLRFLQTSLIHPVGADAPVKVDVRIVCSSNRDPMDEVRAGRFREDLLYRLHVVPIHMPPLRERGEDVVEIAEAALLEFAAEEGKAFDRLGPAVKQIFRTHPWPGNVRQLQNAIRQIVVLHDGEEVTPGMLPQDLIATKLASAMPPPPSNAADGARTPERVERLEDDAPVAAELAVDAVAAVPEAEPALADRVRGIVGVTLADMEREFIEATIVACDGSIPKAARMLDVSPSTLYRKRSAWAAED